MQVELVDERSASLAAIAAEALAADTRWQVVQRIAESESFKKSSRLPALLLYLARCTLLGDRRGLTEQSIGRAVFHKREDYTPTEDSSVRVYIRQLRIRLRDYYLAEGQAESILVGLPKGGYALAFTTSAIIATAAVVPLTPPVAVPTPALQKNDVTARPLWFYVTVLLSAGLLLCAAGWIASAAKQSRSDIPWPLSRVVSNHEQTTLILADAGYSLRLLGDQEIPLDAYIDRSYAKKLMPEHMSKGEAKLMHYLAASQLTSIADANAAATIGVLTSAHLPHLLIRSARDLNPSDLTRGNLVFVGARTSNPWVSLYDEALNYQVVEDLSLDTRSIQNRHPLTGEQAGYAVPESTGTSGEDYAVLAVLPNRSGQGSVLLLEGLRMEGTQAAIALLQNQVLLTQLQEALKAANGGVLPLYFEALLHARSVAGAPVSVEFVSVRPIKK